MDNSVLSKKQLRRQLQKDACVYYLNEGNSFKQIADLKLRMWGWEPDAEWIAKFCIYHGII